MMFSRTALTHLFAVLAAAVVVRAGLAQDMPPVAAVTPAPINFPSATLGGTQFWSDEQVYHSWRIQQNVLTGHYRLLDSRDFRRAWGTFEQCQAKLDELKQAERLPPLAKRTVVTLHGLGRSRDAMDEVGQHLADSGDFGWINISYASSRRSLDEHAQSLARVLGHLDGVEQIDFVCHSLGNLVVRRYLGEASLPSPRWKTDSRIHRMVMIGPPNNGAQLARLFKNNQLFGLVMGPSGKELAITWDEAERRLATPQFEFGIIAGGAGKESLNNPVVDGDDDMVVSVEETRLPGAADFLVVPRWHGLLLHDGHVCDCVGKFLREGHFIAPDKRSPIVSPQAASSGRSNDKAATSGRGESAGERGASAP